MTERKLELSPVILGKAIDAIGVDGITRLHQNYVTIADPDRLAALERLYGACKQWHRSRIGGSEWFDHKHGDDADGLLKQAEDINSRYREFLFALADLAKTEETKGDEAETAETADNEEEYIHPRDMTDAQYVAWARDDLSYLDPNFLSYSQRCELFETIRSLCDRLVRKGELNDD